MPWPGCPLARIPLLGAVLAFKREPAVPIAADPLNRCVPAALPAVSVSRWFHGLRLAPTIGPRIAIAAGLVCSCSGVQPAGAQPHASPATTEPPQRSAHAPRLWSASPRPAPGALELADKIGRQLRRRTSHTLLMICVSPVIGLLKARPLRCYGWAARSPRTPQPTPNGEITHYLRGPRRCHQGAPALLGATSYASGQKLLREGQPPDAISQRLGIRPSAGGDSGCLLGFTVIALQPDS